MTDKEIIKALECCIKRNSCDGCPMHTMNCTARVPMAYALDLINRQKAKIERLEDDIKTKQDANLFAFRSSVAISKADAKAEAINEFAERLKDTKFKHGTDFIVYADNIDNLVKEMADERRDNGDK